MKKSLFGVFLIFSVPVFALEVKPWLGDPYSFFFQSAFSYSHFHHVEGASTQLSAPVNSRNILLNFGVIPSNCFDIQLQSEFGKTNHTNWALRSGALQARLQLLDDISGDPLSFTLGLVLRGVPTHFLKDVSTPYAAQFSVETTAAFGKEWSQGPNWSMRTYGVVTLGQANRGKPWTQQFLVWQYNVYDAHRFTLFALGDIGFGGKQGVNVRHFHGWSNFQHQSIDLGIEYSLKISVWGMLSTTYAHRVFAHNFPEHVNFFMLSYCIPFSLF